MQVSVCECGSVYLSRDGCCHIMLHVVLNNVECLFGGAQLLGPERRSEWGRTRLWGAVGWGIVAPIAGFIVDQTSPL